MSELAVDNLNMMLALPEMVLAICGMALLMLGVFVKKGATALVSAGAVVALGLTASLVAFGGSSSESGFGGQFMVDDLAVYLKLLILLGAILSIFLSIDYLTRENLLRFEFPVLILFAALGMMLMVSADDFLTLYIGLELQSLALYVLASFHRDTVKSAEAGLKYFVLGAIASGMLLYGISMVYGFAGTTQFGLIADVLSQQDQIGLGLILGLVFIAVGLAFKVSAVPFHMWTPDVYEGAPTPVTALFAMAPKIAAIGLFLRVLLDPFGGIGDQWQQIVIVISVASMILGAFAALRQENIKRLMAYSSIGHMGYALLGIAAAADPNATADGVKAVLFYMTIYLFMNAGVFGIILCMRRNGRSVETIEHLSGLSKTHPGMSLAMAILMFSMAGIPPLAGFFSKLYVFLAALDAALYIPAIIGVLSSAVAAFYYLRIIKVMYFDENEAAIDSGMAMPLRLVVTMTTLFTLVAVVVLGPLSDRAAAVGDTVAAEIRETELGRAEY